MNGVLVADKPLGPTSHDVVTRVRRALGFHRVGHTGTLDPLATGVLPLVVGRATRLASLLSATVKEYIAEIRFGVATPTYDADARFIRDPVTEAPLGLESPPPEPPGLSRDVIEATLAQFRGTFLQVPPPYSAKKTDGIASYERARRSEPVAPRPVSVTAYEVVLEDYAGGLARVRLSCSAGFYVRSLAHDVGQRLRCGAHLETLRRHRAGEFTLREAVTLDEIERRGPTACLIPMDRLLQDLPGVRLTPRGARRASHGNVLTPEDMDLPPERPDPGEWPEGRRLRLLGPSNDLLAIAEPRPNGILHPVIVLV